MEPEILLRCSQRTANSPFPEAHNPVHNLPSYLFLYDPFSLHSPVMPRSSQWSISFNFSYQNVEYISFLSHAFYILNYWNILKHYL
jgi:hypothetical protein